VALSSLWSAALLLAMMQLPGQNPPWTPNPNAPPRPPEVDHHLPSDEPPQPGEKRNRPKIDTPQVKRDADELAKLAGAIPSAVEHANKGVLSKDLNERLKRIEKLSKKLRRELFQ
jgi:hypothetical protein